MHKVMVHPADYDHCREAINLAFELFPLEIGGKKVLVKPNALKDSDPDAHPSGLNSKPGPLGPDLY